MSTSLTDGDNGSSGIAGSFRWSSPLDIFALDNRSKAALHFPANSNLEKDRASFVVSCLISGPLGSFCCKVLPSFTSSISSPFNQRVSLLSRQAICSLVFEDLLGFCNNRMGSTTVAFSAIDSVADADP